MSALLTVHCPAIHCEGCAGAIQRSLGKLAGVERVEVNIAQKNVTVQYNKDTVDPNAINKRLELAGFPVE